MKIYDNKLSSVYKKQFMVALFGLICELPNLIFSVIVAFSANNVLCWVDSVVSLSTTLHYVIVMYISNKMRKETGDNYNYGMDRLEVFTSFICDLLIVVAMLALFGTSIYGLFVPQVPTESIGLFALLKASNIAFDIYFVITGYIIKKKHPSRLNETEFKFYLNALTHDVLVGITVTVCYFFRTEKFVCYLSSIVGIIAISVFIVDYIKHIRDSIKELADVSIPLDDQDSIYDIVINNKGDIKRIESVNCHKLNNTIYVDIQIAFNEEVTYSTQINFLNRVKAEVHEILPGSRVRLVFEKNDELPKTEEQ